MNYDINYEDPKFKQVESDKQAALTESKNTYDNMINQSDKFYQDQMNAVKNYADTQQKLQQENTDFAIEQINQQKDQTKKDYTKEQAGAYVDWQKQSNQYGANAEQQAAQGLNNTGYSESSQVSMYNTYQNRVATARESYNKAVLNYDNAIKDAQLQNNSKLAEIAFNALQTQLELSLQGFQYKNTLIMDQMNKKQELENTYYGRYQDVLQQMNTENAMAEQVRQYNESLAMQKQQFQEQIRQYNQSYELDIKKYNESIRQFNEEIARLKAQDAAENAYKIKQLEQQKAQLAEQKRQADLDYKVKQQQLAQSQAQWEKEYALSKQKLSASSGSSSIKKSSTSSVSKAKKSSSSGSILDGMAKGVGQSSYNSTLKILRTLVGLQTNKAKKRQIAEDFLARTNLSDTQITNALKSLGLS
ncbi:MAG: hypothetical protein J6D28_04640 [Bacilli bacterium]|nr:hypothetical protein [Bacilli bacterium]